MTVVESPITPEQKVLMDKMVGGIPPRGAAKSKPATEEKWSLENGALTQRSQPKASPPKKAAPEIPKPETIQPLFDKGELATGTKSLFGAPSQERLVKAKPKAKPVAAPKSVVEGIEDELSDHSKNRKSLPGQKHIGGEEAVHRDDIIKQNIESIAKEHKVKPDIAERAMNDALSLQQQHWKNENSVIKDAMKRLGKGRNAGFLSLHENQHGKDYSKIKGFDEIAQEVALAHPHMGWDPHNTDTSKKLWDLIRKTRTPQPQLHDEDVAKHASAMIKQLAKKPAKTEKPLFDPAEFDKAHDEFAMEPKRKALTKVDISKKIEPAVLDLLKQSHDSAQGRSHFDKFDPWFHTGKMADNLRQMSKHITGEEFHKLSSKDQRYVVESALESLHKNGKADRALGPGHNGKEQHTYLYQEPPVKAQATAGNNPPEPSSIKPLGFVSHGHDEKSIKNIQSRIDAHKDKLSKVDADISHIEKSGSKAGLSSLVKAKEKFLDDINQEEKRLYHAQREIHANSAAHPLEKYAASARIDAEQRIDNGVKGALSEEQIAKNIHPHMEAEIAKRHPELSSEAKAEATKLASSSLARTPMDGIDSAVKKAVDSVAPKPVEIKDKIASSGSGLHGLLSEASAILSKINPSKKIDMSSMTKSQMADSLADHLNELNGLQSQMTGKEQGPIHDLFAKIPAKIRDDADFVNNGSIKGRQFNSLAKGKPSEVEARAAEKQEAPPVVAPKIPKTDDEIRSFLKEKIGSDVDAEKAIGHWGRIEKRLKDVGKPDTDSMLKSVMEGGKEATLKSGITPDMGRAYDAAVSHHSIEKLKSFADSVQGTAPSNSRAIHHIVKHEATPPAAPPPKAAPPAVTTGKSKDGKSLAIKEVTAHGWTGWHALVDGKKVESFGDKYHIKFSDKGSTRTPLKIDSQKAAELWLKKNSHVEEAASEPFKKILEKKPDIKDADAVLKKAMADNESLSPDILLKQAEKYTTPGEGYNRNIAEPAKRLQSMIDRGFSADSIKIAAGELRIRLDLHAKGKADPGVKLEKANPKPVSFFGSSEAESITHRLANSAMDQQAKNGFVSGGLEFGGKYSKLSDKDKMLVIKGLASRGLVSPTMARKKKPPLGREVFDEVSAASKRIVEDHRMIATNRHIPVQESAEYSRAIDGPTPSTEKNPKANQVAEAPPSKTPQAGQPSPARQKAIDAQRIKQSAEDRVSDLKSAIKDNGGHSANSVDNIETIRRSMWDKYGADSPSHKEIHDMMDQMRNETPEPFKKILEKKAQAKPAAKPEVKLDEDGLKRLKELIAEHQPLTAEEEKRMGLHERRSVTITRSAHRQGMAEYVKALKGGATQEEAKLRANNIAKELWKKNGYGDSYPAVGNFIHHTYTTAPKPPFSHADPEVMRAANRKARSADDVVDFLKKATGDDFIVHKSHGGRGEGIRSVEFYDKSDSRRKFTLDGYDIRSTKLGEIANMVPDKLAPSEKFINDMVYQAKSSGGKGDLEGEDLGKLFGIDLDGPPSTEPTSGQFSKLFRRSGPEQPAGEPVVAHPPAAKQESSRELWSADKQPWRADQHAGQKVVKDLGDGYSMTTQLDSNGKVVPVTFHDGREFIHVTKDKKGAWFYRSFMGTGNKTAGQWYPTGGLAKDKSGGGWIIKGDPAADKGYGRPELAKMSDHLNKVLPHDDDKVNEMLKELHGGKMPDVVTNSKPHIFEVDSLSDKASILDSWKHNVLNKIWGKRASHPDAPIPSEEPFKSKLNKIFYKSGPEQPAGEHVIAHPQKKPDIKSENMIKSVESLGHVNPMNRKEIVIGGAAVEVSPSINHENGIWLKSIRSIDPGKGEGAKVLMKLTNLADKHGVSIHGKAVPFGSGMSKEKLVKWYERHGFKVDGDSFEYTPEKPIKLSASSKFRGEGDGHKPDLISLIKQVESGAENGALVSARDLRKHAGMGKEEFDDHVLKLAAEGKLMMHRHDYPAGLTDKELAELVKGPEGRYFVGMALRRNTPEPKEFTTKLIPKAGKPTTAMSSDARKVNELSLNGYIINKGPKDAERLLSKYLVDNELPPLNEASLVYLRTLAKLHNSGQTVFDVKHIEKARAAVKEFLDKK